MMRLLSFFKISATFSLLVLLTINCGHGPIYKSVSEAKMQKETQFIGFDNQSAIRYAISNDNDYLYVRIEALSRPSVLKIVQSGFYLYIDTLGKKSRDTYLNYPVGVTDQLFKAKLFRAEDKENAAEKGKLELESQIKDIGQYGAFYSNEQEESVENDIEKGFAFRLKAGEYGSLNYYAAIPLNKISKGGINSLDNLSVGIISGAFKRPNLAGSSRGNGRRGGAAMRGVPQIDHTANMDREKLRDMYLMSQPINFWINVQLYKK